MQKLAPIAVLLVAVLGSTDAHGQELEIAGHGVALAGGVTSTIAALIYAFEGDAFDSGWVMVSFVTAALNLGSAIGLASMTDEPIAIVGIAVNGVLAAVPLYWAGRSAWSGAPPGAPIDTPIPTSRAVSVVSLRF